VNDLLRLVTHAFHSEECSVMVDALLRENRCVKDEELAAVLKLHQKQVRKWLSEMKAGSIVKSENRQKEARQQGERPTTHLYWYIDYKHFVDTIKYRLHKISRQFEDEKSLQVQLQMYVCTKCKMGYDALQAAELAQTGWTCAECGGEIEELSSNEGVSKTHNRLKAFYAQIKQIIELVKHINDNPPLPKFPRHTIAMGILGEPISSPLLDGSSSSSHGSSSSGRSNAGASVGIPGTIDVYVDIVGNDSASQTKQETVASNPAPSWFNPSSSTPATTATTTTATTSNADQGGMDDENYKLYVKQYMEEMRRREMLAADEAQIHHTNHNEKDNHNQPATHKRPHDDHSNGDAKKRRVVEEEVKEEEATWEDPLVKVGDDQIPFSQVLDNDDIIQKMTSDEYEAYAAVHMQYLQQYG